MNVDVIGAAAAWPVAIRPSRRIVLLALAVSPLVRAQPTVKAEPGRLEEPWRSTVERLLGGAPTREGRIEVVLPDLADSGNSVPLAVQVDSPMTLEDHVRQIHVVAEGNPRPWVASFELNSGTGRAKVETYIRLSDTQTVAVYAQMSDGSWWVRRTQVTVTIGACESLSARY
jgi:sulfur-oxidizing protein SoxY